MPIRTPNETSGQDIFDQGRYNTELREWVFGSEDSGTHRERL